MIVAAFVRLYLQVHRYWVEVWNWHNFVTESPKLRAIFCFRQIYMCKVIAVTGSKITDLSIRVSHFIVMAPKWHPTDPSLKLSRFHIWYWERMCPLHEIARFTTLLHMVTVLVLISNSDKNTPKTGLTLTVPNSTRLHSLFYLDAAENVALWRQYVFADANCKSQIEIKSCVWVECLQHYKSWWCSQIYAWVHGQLGAYVGCLSWFLNTFGMTLLISVCEIQRSKAPLNVKLVMCTLHTCTYIHIQTEIHIYMIHMHIYIHTYMHVLYICTTHIHATNCSHDYEYIYAIRIHPSGLKNETWMKLMKIMHFVSLSFLSAIQTF